MSYNRSLDLMAISLAASIAGLPVKAAKYMHAASVDASAHDALEAIGAANQKPLTASQLEAAKKKKKKAKASSEIRQMFAGVEDDDMPGEETATEADDETEAEDGEVMKVESSSAFAKRLRAALTSGADEIGVEDEAEAESDSEEKDEDAAVVAARAVIAKAEKAKALKAKARKALAMPELEGDISELEPNEVGQECKEEVPEHKETSRFARTLRNLAARQKKAA